MTADEYGASCHGVAMVEDDVVEHEPDRFLMVAAAAFVSELKL